MFSIKGIRNASARGMRKIASGMIPLPIKSYYIFFKSINEFGVIRHGSSKMPYVAITFDDGPNPYLTPKILKILKNNNIKATFFLVGKKVRRYPEIARQIVEEGHDIGNHTYSHSNLIANSKKKIEKEIMMSEKAIVEITGVMPKYFRPPMGFYNSKVKKTAIAMGYKFVLWNIRTFDSSGINITGSKAIISKTKKLAHPGDIILMHDSKSLIKTMVDRKATVAALPFVIFDLKNKGLRPVKISKLLRYSEK